MARLRVHGFAISIDGHGARALFGDQSIIPVRGQLTRMIPQADVRYGLSIRTS
jgi:hypothetical protein